MYKLILYSLLLFFSANLFAQDGIHTRDQSLPCVEKNFNVLVHLSVDSTTRKPFLSGIDVDNLMEKITEYFEPICMSFTSCEVNIIENYTFHNLLDSIRLTELDVLFAKPHRLNIFVLGTIPDARCGTSTFYGIDKIDGGNIFLASDSCPSELDQQLSHHLGHFFGLSDTYRGSEIELVNDPNCAIVADSICDTPTDPFGRYVDSLNVYLDVLQEQVSMGAFVSDCEFVHDRKDPNGQYYQPLVGNVMAAYPCQCGFTNEQFEKIVRNYNKSNFKPY